MLFRSQLKVVKQTQIDNPTAYSNTVMTSLNTVPRGKALTPDEIKAYVAQQRVLAAQQQQTRPTIQQPANTPLVIPASSINIRPQSVTTINRGLNQQ